MERVTAVVAAAGSGARMGAGKNKVYLPLCGKPILHHTLKAFENSGVGDLVLVSDDPEEAARAAETIALPIKIVRGGRTRTESVYLGLQAARGADIVLIHDGARPLVSRGLIAACIRSARDFGSGVAAAPSKDTVKVVTDGVVAATPPRETVYRAQTPQAFRYNLIMGAYASGLEATDDAALFEKTGREVRIVPSDETNIKITTPEDLKIARALMDFRPRVGHGYDVHPLAEGRKLVLGGVEIPYEKGLLGHSDADALTHALIDALLGAAGLPDIGRQFPDTDPKYQDADSIKLLERTRELLEERGFVAEYADATVVAQRPRLAGYIGQIEQILSQALGAPVHVKAKTAEGLGFAGRGEGIEAHAVVIGGMPDGG